jgi:hypothetical protein
MQNGDQQGGVQSEVRCRTDHDASRSLISNSDGFRATISVAYAWTPLGVTNFKHNKRESPAGLTVSRASPIAGTLISATNSEYWNDMKRWRFGHPRAILLDNG